MFTNVMAAEAALVRSWVVQLFEVSLAEVLVVGALVFTNTLRIISKPYQLWAIKTKSNRGCCDKI